MGNEQTINLTNQDIKPKGCCGKVSLYIEDKSIQSSDISCAICFEIYKSPRLMKCKHTFCEPCIQDWGKCRTTSCPYCRTELKKSKKNYGKIDRKTQTKIKMTKLKCRGCHWSGNAIQYLIQFEQNPTIDEDELPCEKTHEQADAEEQRIISFQGCEQKKETVSQSNQRQQETILTKQSLDEFLSPDHMKVMRLIQNDSIFINQNINEQPVYVDMEKQLIESRQKSWEDYLFNDEDLMF